MIKGRYLHLVQAPAPSPSNHLSNLGRQWGAPSNIYLWRTTTDPEFDRSQSGKGTSPDCPWPVSTTNLATFLPVWAASQAYLKLFRYKKGCPLSPLLIAIYLNDIDSIADGVKGALTGTPIFLGTHILFADDLCLMSNNPNHMQTMLNKLGAYAQRNSLCQDTKVWGDALQLLHQQSAPSLIWWRAAPLHRLLQKSGHGLWQTYQFEYCSWCSATSIHR